MNKDIAVDVDISSWAGKPVPPDIRRIATAPAWTCDVEQALIHTALWTRPPVVTGLHLSDWWAWLRYLPAISSKPELRLAKAWTSLDAHQKSVLSDDFGVGFSTFFLISEMAFLSFVETSYFLKRVAPKNHYRLRGSRKVGPKKTPDYVGRDNHGRWSVLECKGSQATRACLAEAMATGVGQKRNLQRNLGPRFALSLVMGLYVPQWKRSDGPLLSIRDPDWDDLAIAFSEIPEERLLAALGQLTYAKHFALMGLPTVAASLAGAETDKLKKIETSPWEMRRLMGTREQTDILRFQTAYPLPLGAMTVDDRVVAAIKFSMGCPRETVEELLKAQDLRAFLARTVVAASQRSWVAKRQDTEVIVMSPFGFDLVLETVFAEKDDRK
jgi:hypothetical protein